MKLRRGEFPHHGAKAAVSSTWSTFSRSCRTPVWPQSCPWRAGACALKAVAAAGGGPVGRARFACAQLLCSRLGLKRVSREPRSPACLLGSWKAAQTRGVRTSPALTTYRTLSLKNKEKCYSKYVCKLCLGLHGKPSEPRADI